MRMTPASLTPGDPTVVPFLSAIALIIIVTDHRIVSYRRIVLCVCLSAHFIAAACDLKINPAFKLDYLYRTLLSDYHTRI